MADVHLANPQLKHLAIIMDGNGRWAKQRHMPRVMGHQQGAKAARKVIQYCANAELETLTLFAFSSENWRRPKDEVNVLMDLLFSTLDSEIQQLHEHRIRLRFIGDLEQFADSLRNKIDQAQVLTQHNTGLQLVVALNYGGQWDITQACQRLAKQVNSGQLTPEQITPAHIEQQLATFDLSEPDLFIRTGGEQRLSNFLLWQLAYTELYFTATLWPDFDQKALRQALDDFQQRQRRFGQTAEQVYDLHVSKLKPSC
ncbi:MAG: isoprenyl transferase [Methylococcales bacterium]|nr:isoprenyl transferase [Methylococcales bacterium]